MFNLLALGCSERKSLAPDARLSTVGGVAPGWLSMQAIVGCVCRKEPKLCSSRVRSEAQADKCLARFYSHQRKWGRPVSAILQTLKQDQIVSSPCQNDSIESSCHRHLILKRHFVEGHASTASESRDKCLALQQDGEGRQTRATAEDSSLRLGANFGFRKV